MWPLKSKQGFYITLEWRFTALQRLKSTAIAATETLSKDHSGHQIAGKNSAKQVWKALQTIEAMKQFNEYIVIRFRW